LCGLTPHGGVTTANAEWTAAKLTINPIAEIANTRNMAASYLQVPRM
jgi:hypothetical protein